MAIAVVPFCFCAAENSSAHIPHGHHRAAATPATGGSHHPAIKTGDESDSLHKKWTIPWSKPCRDAMRAYHRRKSGPATD